MPYIHQIYLIHLIFHIGFSLDKTAASDTLHLLSDSLAAEQSIYIPSEYKLDARKRRRMAPIVAAVAAATVADTSHEVYDNDCPETANVTLVEHAADQARIANLKVHGILYDMQQKQINTFTYKILI